MLVAPLLCPEEEEVLMMVALSALWMPILLSAVAVFIASSAIHMVVKWHNSDFKKLPDECFASIGL